MADTCAVVVHKVADDGLAVLDQDTDRVSLFSSLFLLRMGLPSGNRS
jgi:hypothetical protein